MKLSSTSFDHGGRIPAAYAFAQPDPAQHAVFAGNKNPHLAWTDVPEGTRSFCLICVDPDAPTVADDVNKEGRTVPKDLPRADFYHWILVDVPPECREIAAASCSDGVVAKGKASPPGPPGSRQGVNDYTAWFEGDPEMGGVYRGYDGPAPPWNDERVHRYHFRLFALDVPHLDVRGDFRASDALAAMEGHVLAEAVWTGTYTQNPDLV